MEKENEGWKQTNSIQATYLEEQSEMALSLWKLTHNQLFGGLFKKECAGRRGLLRSIYERRTQRDHTRLGIDHKPLAQVQGEWDTGGGRNEPRGEGSHRGP